MLKELKMNKEVFVAILDSGCSFDTYEKLSVQIDDNYNCEITKQKKINFNHGDVISNIIKAENINIYDIQVFNENLTTTPIQVFHALKYLLDKKIDVINLSLGFTSNFVEIKELCEKLIKKGVTIIASYPRRSNANVYPASYDEVIKVTSEFMAKDDKVVALKSKELFFGANPFSNKKEVSGSSVAVAKFTSEFCDYLKKGFTKDEILSEFSQRRVHEAK